MKYPTSRWLLDGFKTKVLNSKITKDIQYHVVETGICIKSKPKIIGTVSFRSFITVTTE
jgi:hypothetical protein